MTNLVNERTPYNGRFFIFRNFVHINSELSTEKPIVIHNFSPNFPLNPFNFPHHCRDFPPRGEGYPAILLLIHKDMDEFSTGFRKVIHSFCRFFHNRASELSVQVRSNIPAYWGNNLAISVYMRLIHFFPFSPSTITIVLSTVIDQLSTGIFESGVG